MTARTGGTFWTPWRIGGWGLAVALVLTPAVAMQFSDEWQWRPQGFALAAIVFGGMGLVIEKAARSTPSNAFRFGVVVALVAGFLQTWMNLVGGFIGPDHPGNMMFHGVTGLAIAGCWIARYRADGMVRAFLSAAVMEMLAGLIGATGGDGNIRVLLPAAAFAGLWLLSAFLFWKASRNG